MLMEEDVKFDVHKAKKCTFVTTRPLIWAKTIELHLRETENPYYSSKYTSEDGLYIEYMLYNEKTRERKLSINIYVKTGVVLIQGEHYQFWAEKVFPILKDQVETYVSRRTFTNMGSLWNENITLKAALRNLETNYSTISKELQTVQEKSKEIGKVVKAADEENKLTRRINHFGGSVSAEAKVASASSDIADLESQISDIRSRVRRKISEIQMTTEVGVPLLPYYYHPGHPYLASRHLYADLASLHTDLAVVQDKIVADIGELKSRLNVIDNAFESMDELSTSNNATLRKIEGEQKNINSNMESINCNLAEMKRKMKLCWYDFHM